MIRYVFAFLALAWTCATPAQPSDPFAAHGCAAGDHPCRLNVIRAHRVHALDTWKADLRSPVTERIHVAPPVIVEYLALENAFNGWSERPRAARMDDAFRKDVEDALRELPREVHRALGAKLIGIYLVDELGGTGFTDVVFDANRQGVAGYVVLDAAVLSRHTANAWATWKENTPFKPEAAWKLQARIEEAAGDNRKNAIQYILLHELGHVLSIGSDFHPGWWLDLKDVPATASFPFTDIAWTVDRAAEKHVPKPAQDFEQRKDVVYYMGAKLEAPQMLPVYDALERTSFPSLYAATRPGDDLAEAFASYVHTVLMKRPWEITIWRDGQKVKTFGACWSEARCAGKRAILEKFLAAP